MVHKILSIRNHKWIREGPFLGLGLTASVFRFTRYSQVRLLPPSATGCTTQTADLCFSHFWKLGSLRRKQQQIWFLLWAHFLVCLWLSSLFFPGSHGKNSSLFLFLQGHWSHHSTQSTGPLLWYHLNLISPKGSTSNYYLGDQGFCIGMSREGGKDGRKHPVKARSSLM